MFPNHTITSPDAGNVPTSVEVGLQASRKGNFQFARQMLQRAIDQIDDNEPGMQEGLLELIADVADAYMRDGKFESARDWYSKGLRRAEATSGAGSQFALKLIARLAEISVLQEDTSGFNDHFESLQRAYLLCADANLSMVLNALIDLSWALCIRGNMPAVQTVNTMISHVKQLEEEERLGMVAA